MKIKIGNYPSRLICNIHTTYMEKKYGIRHDDTKNPPTRFDNFVEVVEDSMQSFYNVFNWIWFDRRKQTIKVHIDRWDTWSMDHTLAPIILPMLVQLKETNHGAPDVDHADVPKELRASKKQRNKYGKNGELDDNHFKRWDWIMDEMIWAFEQKCRDNWEGDYYEYRDLTPEETEQEKAKGDGAYIFGIKRVWEDREGQTAHQERMTNGFRLFGVYLENLWD
jgi:hypothetical protein